MGKIISAVVKLRLIAGPVPPCMKCSCLKGDRTFRRQGFYRVADPFNKNIHRLFPESGKRIPARIIPVDFRRELHPVVLFRKFCPAGRTAADHIPPSDHIDPVAVRFIRRDNFFQQFDEKITVAGIGTAQAEPAVVISAVNSSFSVGQNHPPFRMKIVSTTVPSIQKHLGPQSFFTVCPERFSQNIPPVQTLMRISDFCRPEA